MKFRHSPNKQNSRKQCTAYMYGVVRQLKQSGMVSISATKTPNKLPPG